MARLIVQKDNVFYQTLMVRQETLEIMNFNTYCPGLRPLSSVKVDFKNILKYHLKCKDDRKFWKSAMDQAKNKILPFLDSFSDEGYLISYSDY